MQTVVDTCLDLVVSFQHSTLFLLPSDGIWRRPRGDVWYLCGTYWRDTGRLGDIPHRISSRTDNNIFSLSYRFLSYLYLMYYWSVRYLLHVEDKKWRSKVLKISWINRHLDPKAMKYFMAIKELLLVINAATNFLIYCAFYAKFRRLLRGMFCKVDWQAVFYSDYSDNPT